MLPVQPAPAPAGELTLPDRRSTVLIGFYTSKQRANQAQKAPHPAAVKRIQQLGTVLIFPIGHPNQTVLHKVATCAR